ncbi:MAG: hypothetical protein KY476_20690 [Planctomycetes bacterium]|nr:hypothetical protein [Planctomycetota bacterium]
MLQLLSETEAPHESPSTEPSLPWGCSGATIVLKQPSVIQARFDKAAVAELSPRRIEAMSTGELSRAVRDVGVLHFCDETRLELLDRPTLERLVYLARRTCRNQGY